MQSPSQCQFLFPIYTSKPLPMNLSTWIPLHPNKLAIKFQQPVCMSPPPGRLPELYPTHPTPPLSPISSMHPSCRLRPSI